MLLSRGNWSVLVTRPLSAGLPDRRGAAGGDRRLPSIKAARGGLCRD